ncbi:MAG: porin, partial [Alphaproteobacteria bacterium]|nr:porin [Alphaproteobacteria bacterium]
MRLVRNNTDAGGDSVATLQQLSQKNTHLGGLGVAGGAGVGMMGLCHSVGCGNTPYWPFCGRHVFLTSNEETMKKVLLATTALLGVIALSAPAKADPLKVTVGGSVAFEAGYADEDFDSNYRNYDFTSSPSVVVGAEGKASNGLTYGGKIELANESSFLDDTSTYARKDSIEFDQAVTYLSGKWGRVELGDEDSAANRLTVTAPTGFGTGGFAGDYQKFLLINTVGDTGSLSSPSNNFNLTRSAEGFYFRGLANSYKPTLTESGLEGYEDSTKITYLTPKFSGFQLGLSYTPKVGSVLTGVSRNKYTTYTGGTPALWNQYEDLIETAVNYSNKFDNGLGLGASVGYNHASAVKTTTAANKR